MTVEFRVYERDNPTALIAVLDEAYDKTWYDDLVDVGSGGFTLPHNAPEAAANPGLLDRHNIVRVRIDGVDPFAFLVDDIRRDLADGFDPVTVQGPGVKARLASAVVYPECWPLGDDLVPDVRRFSWVSGDYVPGAEWIAPASWGKQGARPFDDGRPADWADADAELITPETAGNQQDGSSFWLAELTVPTEMDVRFEVAADDEFAFYLCGVELLSTIDRGPFQWDSTSDKSVRLPAGTYPVAVETRNLPRPFAGTNVTWLLFSAMAAAGTGEAAAQRRVVRLSTDAPSGTWIASFAADTTGDLAPNISAAALQAALNALQSITDAGGVTVTGSGPPGDPWVVTFNAFGGQPPLVIDDDGLEPAAVNKTLVVAGSDPNVLLRSNTTDWRMLELPASRPGMTPGQVASVMLSEAQARGALAGVTLTATDAADSDGTPWPHEFDFSAQVGNDNLLSVLQRLADYGVDFDLSPTLDLDLFAVRGTDRSGTVTLAVGDCGTRIEGKPPLSVGYRQGIVNVALVRVGRTWVEYPLSGAPSSDRHEGFLSYGLEPAEGSPAVAVGNVLSAYSAPRKTVTARHAEGDSPAPYGAYDLGDAIMSPTVTGPVAPGWTTAAQRVYGLGGDETDTGEIDWTTVVVAE